MGVLGDLFTLNVREWGRRMLVTSTNYNIAFFDESSRREILPASISFQSF